MKKLAKAVDVKEIVKVLKVWYSYLVFPSGGDSPSSRTTNATSFSVMSQSRGRDGLG